uniref:Ig-like domain-containing protein n=1 Tax=Sander lucioperca TaxID=283035 RepID=A0A8C9YYT5_SANLU
VFYITFYIKQLVHSTVSFPPPINYQKYKMENRFLKGLSAVIPCSFYYPDKLTVKRVMWVQVKSHLLISVRNLKKITTRFQYIGDTNHNCSLKIHQVEHNDTGKYIFRFTTNSKEGKWTGKDGSTLKVVGKFSQYKYSCESSQTTKEGDSVKLTCRNSCDGGNLLSTFTWFKNGEPITEGPTLYLSNMSYTNSGNYTCSLKTHTGTTSGVIHIDVEYGPKNTSVSVRPSMEADAGSNITLTCSSHANPPVENYTWFKIDDGDIMDVGNGPVFVPGDGGQYLCSATNKHGSQNSSVVTLKIKSNSNTLPLFYSILGNMYQRCTNHCYCCCAPDCDYC